VPSSTLFASQITEKVRRFQLFQRYGFAVQLVVMWMSYENGVIAMLRRTFLRSIVTSALFASVSLWASSASNAQSQTDSRFAEAMLRPTYLPSAGILDLALSEAFDQLTYRDISVAAAEAEVTDASDAAAYFHRAVGRLTLLGSHSPERVFRANASAGERKKEIRQMEEEIHQILLAAVDDYTRGLQREPTALDARADRALVYWRLEEKEKALADCEIVLQSPIDNFPMRVMRIRQRLESDDPEGALADCDWVLGHPPTDPLGLRYLPNMREARGEAQQILGREEAIADYTAALNFPGAQEVQVYTVRLSRGCAHYEMGNYFQAIKDFDWMTRSHPAMAFYNRALCYLKLNRLKEALRDFNLAIRWDGEPAYADGTNYIGRGLIWHLLGSEVKARRDYHHAIELYKKWIAKYGDSEAGQHRMKLGLAYATLGETEMARKMLLQAKEEATAQKDADILGAIEKYLRLLSS
jgi:tetratricopeptide (TPR) repeat protein